MLTVFDEKIFIEELTQLPEIYTVDYTFNNAPFYFCMAYYETFINNEWDNSSVERTQKVANTYKKVGCFKFKW